MIYLIGIGAALVFTALTFWYRRALAKRLSPLAEGIETMRRLASQEARYRPPAPGEDRIGDVREHFDAASDEMRTHRLTVLGDMIEEQADGTVAGGTRWFVDADRIVCGWFGVVQSNEDSTPTMMLFSEATTGTFFITARGAPKILLAQPPQIDADYRPWEEGLGRQLALHRSRMESTGSSPTGFRRVEDVDGALAIVKGLRETVKRWRARQPAGALLDQDVRSILRERYDELGPTVIALMRQKK